MPRERRRVSSLPDELSEVYLGPGIFSADRSKSQSRFSSRNSRDTESQPFSMLR